MRRAANLAAVLLAAAAASCHSDAPITAGESSGTSGEQPPRSEERTADKSNRRDATAVRIGEWRRDDKRVALLLDQRTVWQFSFDRDRGKPFFDPLNAGDMRLTTFRPEDHPWHYGLWFSWKLINGANYWEEDRNSGRAEGTTRWSEPRIDLRRDGSAKIELELTYVHSSGRVDLTEARVLEISPVDSGGGYSIDWTSSFEAGERGAVLDRTPMPGEPDGRINGGYAGLSVRLAAAPYRMSVITTERAVNAFDNDRARPSAPALAANFTREEHETGSIAILAHPNNVPGDDPWYVINAEEGMRFVCSAVLAPGVRKMEPGEVWQLTYRVIVQTKEFTPTSLKHTYERWLHTHAPSGDER